MQWLCDVLSGLSPMYNAEDGNGNATIGVIIPLVVIFVLISIASLSLSVFAVKKRAKR